MICPPCQTRNHGKCVSVKGRGKSKVVVKTMCDCQHQATGVNRVGMELETRIANPAPSTGTAAASAYGTAYRVAG